MGGDRYAWYWVYVWEAVKDSNIKVVVWVWAGRGVLRNGGDQNRKKAVGMMETVAVKKRTPEERKKAGVAKQKRYLEKNRGKVNARRREHYRKNKERINVKRRADYSQRSKPDTI